MGWDHHEDDNKIRKQHTTFITFYNLYNFFEDDEQELCQQQQRLFEYFRNGLGQGQDTRTRPTPTRGPTNEEKEHLFNVWLQIKGHQSLEPTEHEWDYLYELWVEMVVSQGQGGNKNH